MSERNLKEEFEKLNIVSFDCSGIATKKDVFKALDTINAHLANNSDKKSLDCIAKIKEDRESRRFNR